MGKYIKHAVSLSGAGDCQLKEWGYSVSTDHSEQRLDGLWVFRGHMPAGF